MRNLPQEIKLKFYKLLNHEINIHDFEKWVYKEKLLEKTLSENDYFDIISFNYNTKYSKHDLFEFVNKFIIIGEFETYRLLKLLYDAKRKVPELQGILAKFYYLYCYGYHFLESLGIGYGLEIEDFVGSEEEMNQRLESYFPELDKDLQKVINWIENKEIVPVGLAEDTYDYKFEDYRRM